MATDCVSQAILSLLNEMPTLHLNIEEKVMTPLLHDLLAGQVDVVVGRVGGRALQLPLNYQVLYTEPVCFVARPHHPLAARAQIARSDLAHWRWIVWPTGTLFASVLITPSSITASCSRKTPLNRRQ